MDQEYDFDPHAVARPVNMSLSQLYSLFKQYAGMARGIIINGSKSITSRK